MKPRQALTIFGPAMAALLVAGCSGPLLTDLEPAAGRTTPTPGAAEMGAVENVAVVVPSGLYRAANEPPPPDLGQGTPLSFSAARDEAHWTMVEAHLGDEVAISGGRSADVRVAEADLNGDGVDEALVMIHSGPYCGNGDVCNVWIFGRADGGWQQINGDDDAANTVYLLPETHHGYRDIGLRGFCGDDDCRFRLAWDGDSYEWVADPTPQVSRSG